MSDQLDGCDIDFKEEPQVSDEDLKVYPLFAEALDPNTDITVEQVKAEWEELFSAQET